MNDYMMLWFDNDKNTDLPAKIERAAIYYQKKYGQIADLCLVPTGTIAKGCIFGGIKVQPDTSVFKNNFLIGKNCQKELL